MPPTQLEVPLTVTVTVGDPSTAAKATEPAEIDETSAHMQVLKAADERRFTLGLGYPALKADRGVAADGFRDFVSAPVLEETAWRWMKQSRNVGLHHADGTDYSGEVVESYIWRGPDWTVTSPVDGTQQVIKAGDWLVGVVWSEQAWPLVKKGLINGYSPQGGARRATPSPERLAELRS